MREVLVVNKLVPVVDVLSPRRLLQHPRLSAGQRLESPPQFSVLDRSQFAYLFQAELVRVVERAQTERLKQRHFQLFCASFEVSLQHAVAEVGLPLQLPPRILSVIELLEDLLQRGNPSKTWTYQNIFYSMYCTWYFGMSPGMLTSIGW